MLPLFEKVYVEKQAKGFVNKEKTLKAFVSMADGIHSPNSFHSLPTSAKASRQEDLQNAKELKDMLRLAKQDAAKDSAQALMQTRTPLEGKLRRQRKGIKERQARVQKGEKTGDKGSLKTDKSSEIAEKYEKQNPELKKDALLLLKERLLQGDDKSKESILKELKKFYPDPSLGDEALDFLLESTQNPLREKIQEAKDKLNQDFGREVKAGKNMGKESRAFAEKGLETPENLRNLYRDLTDNPRTPVELFEELNQRFDYEKMQATIKFLFQSLGADLRAQGSSIPRGLLHQMMTECKTLQAILGVYNFFKSRMRLIEKSLKRNGIILKKSLSFKALAKIYMSLVADRYPSPDKVLGLSRSLGVDSTLVGQIILFTQMRDAIRQSSPRLYRSQNHREELWMALIEALEDLEVELEEEEEEELIYYEEDEIEQDEEGKEKQSPEEILVEKQRDKKIQEQKRKWEREDSQDLEF